MKTEWITKEEREIFDAELVSIAADALNLTKITGNTSTDYDYNCLIGALRSRLDKLSNSVDSGRYTYGGCVPN